jgi:hypothetical protein
MFSTPEKWSLTHHVLPRIHHKFTTIYHHAAPQNPQNPLQKWTSTTQGKISEAENLRTSNP